MKKTININEKKKGNRNDLNEAIDIYCVMCEILGLNLLDDNDCEKCFLVANHICNIKKIDFCAFIEALITNDNFEICSNGSKVA